MTHPDGEGRSATFLGLTKTQFLLVLSIVTLLLACTNAATFAFAVSANRARAAENAATAQALKASQCAQREYTQKRIEKSADFLAEHGGPEPIVGVSRAELLAGLRDLRDLRATYNGLDCPTS